MSIPSVGGGDPNGLQRALMNAAEKLLADEAEMFDSTGKTSEKPATAAPGQGQAMVVDLNEGNQPTVTVEGRWLTTGKPTAGATPMPANPGQAAAEQAPPAYAGEAKTAAAADLTQPPTTGRTTVPTPQPGQPSPATPGAVHTPNIPRAVAGPVSTGLTAPGEQVPSPVDSGAKSLTPRPVVTGSQAAIGTPTSINDHPTMQMLVMLKRSGVGFNDAVQVLKNLNPGVKMPPKEILKGFWNTLPAPKDGEVPVAKQPLDNLIRDVSWQKQHPAQQAAAQQQATQPPAARVTPQQAVPNQALPNVVDNADPRAALVPGTLVPGTLAHQAAVSGDSPTLQTVVVNTPTNQVYVAGLSTTEFQRLAAMLGANAPAWFWEIRNHHGLRRLFELPSFARLNAVRIAGVRLLFWLLAVIGLALFWIIGARFGVWF